MNRYELEKIIKERFNELEDAIIYRLHDLSEFKYDKDLTLPMSKARGFLST